MKLSEHRANCKYLTHKHASFFGCTLQEVSLITCGYLACDLFISLILMGIFGSFFLSFIILFIISFFLIKVTAQQLGRFKIGRQQGYLGLYVQKLLHEKLGVDIPFVDRQGLWLTRRSIKC